MNLLTVEKSILIASTSLRLSKSNGPSSKETTLTLAPTSLLFRLRKITKLLQKKMIVYIIEASVAAAARLYKKNEE